MDVLAIQNLKKHFGSKEVLCGIDLSVPCLLYTSDAADD